MLIKNHSILMLLRYLWLFIFLKQIEILNNVKFDLILSSA